VVSVTAVDTLRNAIALAERKVQQDQTRVDQDASRLDASRRQLDADQEELSQTQRDSRTAERTAASAETPTPAPVRLDRAIATTVPSDVLARAGSASPTAATAPQLNAQGQTIGRLINIVA